jgi:hypothetical protein
MLVFWCLWFHNDVIFNGISIAAQVFTCLVKLALFQREMFGFIDPTPEWCLLGEHVFRCEEFSPLASFFIKIRPNFYGAFLKEEKEPNCISLQSSMWLYPSQDSSCRKTCWRWNTLDIHSIGGDALWRGLGERCHSFTMMTWDLCGLNTPLDKKGKGVNLSSSSQLEKHGVSGIDGFFKK